MALSIKQIVNKQVQKVLKKGNRLGSFNQIRQRHFWSTYLFIADPSTNKVSSGTYDLFKTIPGSSGQGYPTNVNLTLRETNWLNAGRVPDNQSFAITEIGATIKAPPLEYGTTPASTGIYANLTSAQKTYLLDGVDRGLPAQDTYNIAFGTVLEMSFLTNNVPLGLLGDFSQSAGIMTSPNNFPPANGDDGLGDVHMANGIPAAMFRRKLQIPIMLQSGENMGMRLVIPRDIELVNPTNTTTTGSPPVSTGATHHGKGWYEVRIDWWAIESFVEKS